MSAYSDYDVKVVKVSMHWMKAQLEPGMTLEQVKQIVQEQDPEVWAVVGYFTPQEEERA